MNICNPISIYRLLETIDPVIIGLNEGFLGNKSVGWFHMIGYEPNTHEMLIFKPVTEGQSFVLSQQRYKDTCKELLNFKLYNN